ncbi:hypothetical protein Tsubulata_016247, partial [Turnera subulata]
VFFFFIIKMGKIQFYYLPLPTILIFLLSAVFFFTLFGQGNCQCHAVTDLKIFQSPVDTQVQSMRQWKVTIFNDCICTQLNIKLACTGFQAPEKIDPSVSALSDDECDINNQQPLYGYETFNFTYASDTQYPFQPVYAEIACS